jgi:FkbM family methyltransferase
LNELAASPSLGRRAALAAEVVGAYVLAEKLFAAQTQGDLVCIPVPPARGWLRQPRLKMLRRQGSDQGVEAISRGGWLAFEPPLLPFVVVAVRAFEGAFYDVGANTGIYALLALQASRKVQVYAFEPLPSVAAMMEENAGWNRGAGRLSIYRGVVSDEVARLPLYLPPESAGVIETSASLDSTFKETVATVIEVESTTLDDFWMERGSPKVGVIKIDTEGTEHRVLAGGRKMLSNDRPLVFYEVLPRAEFSVLAALVEELGYVDLRLQPDAVIMSDQICFDAAAWNHVLVPQEHLERFRDVARTVGLPIIPG